MMVLLSVDMAPEDWQRLCIAAKGETPQVGMVHLTWGVRHPMGGAVPANVGFYETWHRVPDVARQISDDLAEQIAEKVIAGVKRRQEGE